MKYNVNVSGGDSHAKEETMSTDIMGLANLLKNNNTSSMELPAILAMCQKNGFGGGNDFLTILVLLLLVNNGGLFGGQREAAAAALGGADQLQVVTSLYDRIAASQAATTQGFADLNTYLCSAISNVLGSVRDQGDRATSTTEAIGARNYDAIRNVGDSVRECCCAIEKQLISLGCKIDNVGKDLSNQMVGMEGRLALQMERNQNETNEKFCHLENKMEKDRLTAENRVLAARVQQLESQETARTTAAASVSALENFMVNHYKVTGKS